MPGEPWPIDGAKRRTKPPKDYGYVRCMLCTNNWKVWKCTNGMTTTYRNHLRSEHEEIYLKTCEEQGLKQPPLSPLSTQISHQQKSLAVQAREVAFTKQAFIDSIVRWLATGDQSLNVVENPEYRYMMYFGNRTLKEDDLPHRTKVASVCHEMADLNMKQTKERLKGSLGRVALTTDFWSDVILRSFMAVTAHYTTYDDSGHLSLRTELIGFRYTPEGHSGKELAPIFFEILNKAGILHKLGPVTLDNAGNNDTMLRAVEDTLKSSTEFLFKTEGNRLRCFPHVVHLAVQLMLDQLSQVLRGCDLSKSVRAFVRAVHRSSNRRGDLQRIIRTGCADGLFPQELKNYTGLLGDSETRWSSTYFMLKRFLVLMVLLDNPKHSELQKLMLNTEECQLLSDIVKMFEIPHLAQELLAAEKTPTIMSVFPAYEYLGMALRNALVEYPTLKLPIQAGIDKLNEYTDFSRQTKLYGLAVVLHPGMKLTWPRRHWLSNEVETAQAALVEIMLQHRKAERLARAHYCGSAPWMPTPAALSVEDGMSRLRRLAMGPTAGLSESNPTPDSFPSEQREAIAESEDREIILCELNKYLAEHLTLKNVDLLMFWQSIQGSYPYIYRVALDVLAVQASSVPCERVFSSSKRTVTDQRTQLSPTLIEELQIVKWNVKAARNELDFNPHDSLDTKPIILTEDELECE